MKKLILIASSIMILSVGILAQITLPRESNRQEVTQAVGDTKINVVYHRPNVKARKVWGCKTADVIPKGGVTYPCLVPDGQVWRTGANENTTFEVSNDVTINGQALPKGKYGLHTIPNKKEWIIIFSKVNDSWGSYTYDAAKDALRVNAVPAKAPMHDTMSITFGDTSANATSVSIAFEKVKVGFNVNVGDISGRVMSQIRSAIETRKADDMRPMNQGANYVLSSKLKEHYTEAMTWIDKSISIKSTFGNLSIKARVLAEMGKMSEAINTGEMAVSVGKSATPKVDTTNFEKTLEEWKTKK